MENPCLWVETQNSGDKFKSSPICKCETTLHHSLNMPRQNRNRKKQGQRYNKTNQRQESNRAEVDSRPKFTVYIDEGEQAQIEEWVGLKQRTETGGDLFGLWVNNHTAVVQFVLGPGQNCARTSVSFYQDIEYLREAGNYLTQQHGLCNIGQWHSHHRLSLTRPSGGDENTVWGNMPNLGLNRYIVFIATINGYDKSTKVSINPYLFEINQRGARLPVASGILKVLKGQESPFRCNKVIADSVKNGREIYLKQKDEIPKETSNKKRKIYTSKLELWPTVKFQRFEIKITPILTSLL